MTPDTTVYIVDDDDAVLKSLKLLMGAVGIQARTYRNCHDFLEGYDPSGSACLILDVRMPGMSGLELQSRLGESKVDLPVIIISGHGDVPMAVEAMKAGAVDFIEKPFRDQVLLDAVNGALRKAVMKRKSLARKLEYERQRKMLTSREQEVLDLLLAGKTTKEIATLLGISTKTVDYHRLHVFDKMGVDTVVKLVRMAEGINGTV